MAELTSISNLCGTANLGGLQWIEYVPTTWVDASAFNTLVDDAGMRLDDVTLLEGKSWLRMPALAQRRLYKSNSRRTSQGKMYRQEVNGVTPMLTHEASLMMGYMMDYRYLLRMRDRNGQYWVLGTLESPFDFDHSETSADETGLNAYEFTWESESITKPAGYEPA